MLRQQGKEPLFYLTGRKGIEWYRFRGRPVVREWVQISAAPSYGAAAEIGGELVGAYDTPTRAGGVGEVHIVFTEFVSMLTQRTTVRRILPIEVEEEAVPRVSGLRGRRSPSSPLSTRSWTFCSTGTLMPSSGTCCSPRPQPSRLPGAPR
nr:hypothetical protein GCM10020093_019200 [Planobispora longispora]